MRKICAFSGKRGGYGAYVPLMRLVEADPELELLILLADQHGAERFGRTAGEARAAFPDAAVELIEMGTGRGDTGLVRAENLSACLAGAARLLDRHRPDVVLVHGDRGDHAMVAFAALNLGLAVAHTQGGERSGNIDEIQRHAITKLAHVHFPETEAAAERIRRLGEDEWRIHVVGSTYVDRIVQGLYTPPERARASFGLAPGEDFLLAIVHPETLLSREENRELAEVVLDAARQSGLRTVVTYPCSDPGYEEILAALEARSGDERFVVRPNIDNDDYLGLMAAATALVGNSSAALVEAPHLGLPAVNVGRRQEGRERHANVLDVAPAAAAITGAIERVRREGRAASASGPLADGRAAERIVGVLKGLEVDDRLLRKRLAY
ncbi:MAG: UDP-N-acetylglucosamine 2-epimerase [Gaiellaceae bacterium]